LQLFVEFVEGIGDVLEKDQPQHDVLVLRRVDVLAQLGRRLPKLLLDGLFLLGFRGFTFGRAFPSCQ
jgi:hypothetical protein